MAKTLKNELKRQARHRRIRKKISGTSERPRLHVHRSANNLYAQVIDDSQEKVLFGMSTLTKELRSKIKFGGNISAAEVLGESIGLEAKKKGITTIRFDRGGYLYHGRVKAFAQAVRKAGMEF